MLILSRRELERVLILTPSGERIEVVVAEIDHNKIRLGFTADRAVKIDRGEFHGLPKLTRQVRGGNVSVTEGESNGRAATGNRSTE